jgi:ureidoacrylate peracid hydrolase
MTTPTGSILIKARPEPLSIDLDRTAIVVVDMQNDFGAKGGMFERLGIDLSLIQRAVAPTARVLAAGRRAGIPVVYLKMAFRPDLSDAGAPGSRSRKNSIRWEAGKVVLAPDGSESRILIRDTWNSNILDELAPEAGDTLIYKSRFNGFYQTELHDVLQSLGINSLVVTGCTTNICVESTIREAAFRDYNCLLLEDCTAEPPDSRFVGSIHDASLFAIQSAFGWVSNSTEFLGTLEAAPAAVIGQ